MVDTRVTDNREVETRFEVLGPVRVVRGGAAVGTISDLRRRLLAVLLVRAGRVVPTDVLVEALWGTGSPQRPAASLQIHVHRLRQALDGSDRLVSVSGGYQLNVGPDELDAQIFGRLHDEARQAATDRALDSSVVLYRQALELWRGQPYADVDETTVVVPEAKRLSESRLIACEELYEVELACGRARDVVPELTELVTEYPLRERLIGQHMLALYRSGRRTRAEVAYRAAQQRLAKELRAEPGRELRELAEAIRTEDPALDLGPTTVRTPAASVTVRPAQLPPAPGAFFGRQPEFEQLELGATSDAAVVVLAGMAGIGKTGLALRYAHQTAAAYPDGQLYIDLRGHATDPALDPMIALGQLLRGLGADSTQGWESLADATAEYRSITNGRKLLVLLDNAATEDQVRPLLPATDGCLTLVTSRHKLSGLVAREGASRIVLGELPYDDAYALLVRLIGRARLDRDPDSVAALIDACAGLPLALRIAAAQLADEPHRPLSAYLTELRDHGPQALSLGDDESTAVAVAFDLSYQRLDSAHQQLFRRLGLVPGLDFTVEAVAALTGTTPHTARDAVRRLTNAHLLQEHSSGRYRFHDLLRDDARRRAETEDSADVRGEVLERLLAFYYRGKMAAVATRASTRRYPPAPAIPDGLPDIAFDSQQAATAWVRSEFPNITAAIEAASARPEHLHWTWQLAIGSMLPMAGQGYLNDILATAKTSTAAARKAGNRRALANLLTETAAVRRRVDLPVDMAPLTEAIALAEQDDDRPLLAYCLDIAGILEVNNENPDLAEQYLLRSCEIHRADNDHEGQARALDSLATISSRRGDLERAEQQYAEILALGEGDHPRLSSIALPHLVRFRVMLGRLDGIDELIEQAEDAVIRFDNRLKAHVLRLARCVRYRDSGRLAEAFEQAEAAIRSARQLDQPRAHSDAHYQLGACHLAGGAPAAARTEFESAVRWAGSMHSGGCLPPAVRGLAETELADGNLAAAENHALDAVRLAREADWSPVDLAGTVVTLGRVQLALGRPQQALQYAADALTIHRRTHHFLGQARAHRLLGTAMHAIEPRSGDEQLRDALHMFKTYGSPEAAEVQRLLSA